MVGKVEVVEVDYSAHRVHKNVQVNVILLVVVEIIFRGNAL
jgi:hypothetical protein